jgi:hypothetical protein
VSGQLYAATADFLGKEPFVSIFRLEEASDTGNGGQYLG